MNRDVIVFENFLDRSMCKPYINMISEKWQRYKYFDKSETIWSFRTIDITDDSIVLKVKTFLEQKLSVKLNIDQAKIQVWPKNHAGLIHKHDSDSRAHTDFNSLIYLNDNYEGGEFYTENDFVYKPNAGSLTFFDGSNIMHGSKKVLGHDRFTIIFWWKKPTIFHDHHAPF